MNLRTKLAVLGAAIVLTSVSRLEACIWAYGTDLRGLHVEVNDVVGAELIVTLFRQEPAGYWGREKKTRAAEAVNGDLYQRNDYAVVLLHVGEYAEAIRILSAIEKQKPGLYETAVNLGTAYELQGDNVSALRWIREGIRRDRAAHNGTEWLHARIIEAKNAAKADSAWFVTHSVLALDFGTGVLPQMPKQWPLDNSGKVASAEAVRDAIRYQLEERLQFVKAPDPVVASLFFDWANLETLIGTLESAEALHLQAIGFGKEPSRVRPRLADVQTRLQKYRARAR